MNAKTAKFLATLAVLALAFVAVSVVAEDSYAGGATASLNEGASFNSDDAAKEAGYKVSLTKNGTTQYYTCVSATIDAWQYGTDAADAKTDSKKNVIKLIDDVSENSKIQKTNGYYYVELNLNGNTLTQANSTDAGYNDKSKFIYIDNQQSMLIYGGTIKSEVKYTEGVTKKDSVMTLIQSYGALEIGKTGTTTTIDISGVTTPGKAGDRLNEAIALNVTSGTTKISSTVTINAGKNVAVYATYGAGTFGTQNAGSGTGTMSETEKSVIEIDGASITGLIGTTVYTKGSSDPESNNVVTGAKIILKNMTISSDIVSGKRFYNSGSAEPTVGVGGVYGDIIFEDVTFSGKLDVKDKFSITIPAGKKLVNNGTITIATGGNVSGTGKITGNGEIDLKGTLNVTDGEANPSHQVYCTVNIYGDSEWTGYADKTGTWIFNIENKATDMVATFHQLTDGNVKTGAEFTVHKSMALAESNYARNWLDNETVDTVIVETGAKLTLPSGTMIIGAGDSVTLEGTAILEVTGTVTNKGTISMADSAQVQKSKAAKIDLITNSDNGTIVINGEEYAKTTTTNADTASALSTAITTAVGSEDSVAVVLTGNVNDANNTVDLGSKDVSIVLTEKQSNLNLKISDTGSLKIETGGKTYTGTIKIGTQAAITLANVTGDFTITKGSYVLSGTTVSGNITVPANETLRIVGQTIDAATEITLNDGSKVVFEGACTISGDVTINTVNANDSAKVEIDADATLALGANLTIGSAEKTGIKTTVAGVVTYIATEPPAPKTITYYGTMNLYSAFGVTAEVTGTLVNNGVLNLYTGADISAITVSGSGDIKDKSSDTDMEDLTVTGESAQGVITYTANQNVIVTGTWTLIKNADITIKGSLQVPAGAKVIVNAGAKLTILNPTAVADIEGSIVIDGVDGSIAAGQFNVTSGTANISGSATINGIMNVPGVSANQTAAVIVKENGSFNLTKTGQMIVGDYGGITVMDDSTFVISGAINATNIYNYGDITISTSVPAIADSTIFMRSNGASVDIVKFTFDKNYRTLTITDSGLVYYTDKETNPYTVYKVGTPQTNFTTNVNSIVINGTMSTSIAGSSDYYGAVTGLKVTETVSSYAYDAMDYAKYAVRGYVAPAEKAYTNSMEVTGEIQTALTYVGTGTATTNVYSFASVTFDAQEKAIVPADSELHIGYNVTLVNTGKLTVAGTFDADDWQITTALVNPVFNNTAGTLTMSGSGKATTLNAVAGTVNGAKIEVGVIPVIYTYVTVDTVLKMANLDSAIDDIVLLGSNLMYVTNTLPATAEMTLSGGSLSIGYDAGDDVTLTIADGAVLKGSGTVYVNGSMYAYNQNDVKGNTVISDVKKVQVDEKGKVVKNGWALWTNIVSSLNTAQSGDVITIARTTGNVEMKANAEIKSGVKLVVPEDTAPIYLYDGVTLTVNGILATAMNIIAEHQFDTSAVDTQNKRTSAVVVNGIIYLPDATAFSNTYGVSTAGNDVRLTAGAPIAGAYFKTEDNNVIAGVSSVAYVMDDIIGPVTLNGKISASEVYFKGTDDSSRLVIGADITGYDTEISIAALYLIDAILQNTSTGTFTGVVGNANGTFELAAATGAFSVEDDDGKLVIAGTFDTSDKGKISVKTGAAYTGTGLVVTAYSKSPMSIAAGATLYVDSTGGTINSLTVNGTLHVLASDSLTVGTNLVVAGNVIVDPATTSKSSGTLAITSEAYIGMKSSDLTDSSAQYVLAAEAAASVAGNISPGAAATIFVAAGSTVDDAAQEILDDMSHSVVFVVEGKEWFTVYTNSASKTIKVTSAPAENAQLLAWYYSATNAVGNPEAISIKGNDGKTLTAKLEYNIYNVYILTDNGIKSVAIDGIEMVHAGNNLFAAYDDLNPLSSKLGGKLVAGTHTVSYTTYSGYTGLVNLYTEDNTILKDLKFTLSGTDDLNVTLQLYGTEQTITPEPEPVVESEWNITTILLLILVILIAIMAVIVAIRLNRS